MIANKTFSVGFLILTTCLWIVKSGDTDPVPSTSKDVNPSLGNQRQNNPITEEQLAQQKNTINELTKTLNENSNIIGNSRKEVLKLMTPEEAKAEASWYKTVVEKVTEITSSISASNSAKNFEQPEQKFKFYTQLTNNLIDAIDIQTRLKNRYTEVQNRPRKSQIEEKLDEQSHTINQILRTLNDNSVIINNSRKKFYKFVSEAESKDDISDYNQLTSKVTGITASLTTLKAGGDSVGRTLEQKFQFQATIIKNINDAITIQARMKIRYAQMRNNEEDKLAKLLDKIEKLKQAELQRRSNDQKNSPARQQQLAQEYAAGDKLATDLYNQVQALRVIISNVYVDTELYYQKKQPLQEIYNSYKKHLENVQNRRTPEPNPQKHVAQVSQTQSVPKPSTAGSQSQATQKQVSFAPQVQPAQGTHNQGTSQQITPNTSRGGSSSNGKMSKY